MRMICTISQTTVPLPLDFSTAYEWVGAGQGLTLCDMFRDHDTEAPVNGLEDYKFSEKFAIVHPRFWNMWNPQFIYNTCHTPSDLLRGKHVCVDFTSPHRDEGVKRLILTTLRGCQPVRMSDVQVSQSGATGLWMLVVSCRQSQAPSPSVTYARNGFASATLLSTIFRRPGVPSSWQTIWIR